MAGTVKILSTSPFIEGKDYVQIVEWTGPASYTTGGEPFSLIEAGFGKEATFRYAITCWTQNLSEQGTYRPGEFVYNGSKVFVEDTVTGKELEAAKNLSKVKALFEIHCVAN